jgi:aminotransferase
MVKGVKGILINYPCNPTGASYTSSELEALAKVFQKHDLIVLSDEIYDELTYDFDHTAFPTLSGMRDRTVYLNGFSKAHAMTGFRVGYACGPQDIIGAMTKIHQYTMLCVSITGQMAAIEALKGGIKDVAAMKKEYNQRRDFIVEALNAMGLKCHMPQGAFYVFPSIGSTGESSMDFAKNLLQQQKVALVPGVAFGTSCADHVRIAYAASMENLKEATVRIKTYLNKTK